MAARVDENTMAARDPPSYDSGIPLSEADAKTMMDKIEARSKWLKGNGNAPKKASTVHKWLKAKAHEVSKHTIQGWKRYLARDPPSYDSGTLLSEADAKTMMDKIEARTKWLKAKRRDLLRRNIANGKASTVQKWLKAKAHEVPKQTIHRWKHYLARDPPSYDSGTLLSEADAKTMMDKIEARRKWFKAIANEMASNSRVTVTAEDIAESDDTLRGALSTWILKRGPVDYNKFQSAYFSVMRDHLFVDPDFAAGETQVVRQQRLMAMYRRIHEETWGQDWAAGIVRQPNGGEAAAEGTRRVREEYEKGTIAGDDPKAFRDKYRFLPYRFLPHGTNLRNMWAAMQREVYKTCPGNYIKLKAAFQQYRDANANWKDVLLAYRADKIKEWNQDYRCRCRWNQDYRCRCTKSRSGIKEWNQAADVDPDIALSKRARRDTHDTPPHKRAAVGGSDVVVERTDSEIITAALVRSPCPHEVGPMTVEHPGRRLHGVKGPCPREVGHTPPCDDSGRVREGCEKGTIAGDDPKAFGDKYRFTLHGETETNLRNIWAAMQREAYKTCPVSARRTRQLKTTFQQYRDANTNWKDILLAYRADKIKEWNQDSSSRDWVQPRLGSECCLADSLLGSTEAATTDAYRSNSTHGATHSSADQGPLQW